MKREITIEQIETIDNFSETLPLHTISVVNWNLFPYAPQASFRIAYTREELCIKFYVTEKHVKGSYLKDNEPVCNDSCVEFFVRPQGSEYYYNFEFNPIGTLLAAKRVTRANAIRFNDDELSRITRIPSLGRAPINLSDKLTSWTLFVTIPFDLLGCCEIPSELQANLYKCGDQTQQPHYLSWSPIYCEQPNFHTPNMFGTIYTMASK
ncbi:MAG: carbohydrate-binding family 9-like protein [Rikenellaceae bacterium]